VDDWNGPVKELVVSYGGQPKPAMLISRKHVAKFMIDCLQNPDQGFMIRA
jgi:hypothetical protein